MRRLHRPCAWKHGGLKMKEACSLGPGWRVLLHQGPNTRQSSATERLTLLGWEGQGEEPLHGGKRCLVCECVSTRVHTGSSTPRCVWGAVIAIHEKERRHWKPLLSTSSWTAPTPRRGFFPSKALGIQTLTVGPFSWHVTPKPDVLTSGGACTSLPLAFNLCQADESAVSKLRLWRETGLGSGLDSVTLTVWPATAHELPVHGG